MQVAPPPSPGPRIEELGDTLVVTFRPRRSWGDIVFLAFWLTFWTFGGFAAMFALPRAGWGGRIFLTCWLCAWAFGEGFAALQIAWQLAGREQLLLTPNRLEIKQQIRRFARTRALHVLAVDDIWAERVPSDCDEQPRSDFRLVVLSHGERSYVGEGMDEREAEDVAAVVRARVRPPARWADEPTEFGFARPAEPEPPAAELPVAVEPSQPAVRWTWVLPRILPPLVGAALLAVAAWAILGVVRRPPELPKIRWPTVATPTPPAPPVPRSPAAPPRREDFTDARAYAAASTHYALTSARAKVHTRPVCNRRVTWTSWTCRAWATPKLPPFAGQRLLYRCFVSYQPQPAGPAARTIECGPENPPPL